MLGSLRHNLLAKNITPWIAWRREVYKEEAVDTHVLADEKGPVTISQTNIGTEQTKEVI